MIVFYVEDLQAETTTLEADEFHHCCKVLRHKVGAVLQLTDGQGTQATAELLQIAKQTASLKVLTRESQAKPSTQIHLYVAPPKTRARWEWLVEKSVELGISSLTALTTQRTERSRLNQERTEKIMRSAAMQSLQAFHPSYRGMRSMTNVLDDLPPDIDKYLAHYRPGQPDLYRSTVNNSQAAIFIGPEGDFTEEEIKRCNDLDFLCVNISEHRLRTETAAVTVVALLKVIGY